MRELLCLIALTVSFGQAAAAPMFAAEGPPIDVVILGTFHFDNPGLDMANTQVDDVLGAKRQGEIARILDGLARFKPTKIAVESQRRQAGTSFSEKYPIFRAGKAQPSASEVAQIGFRLAQQLKHPNVYAVDVDGDFPFEPVQAYAKKMGRDAKLGGRLAAVQAMTAEITKQLTTQSLGRVLRALNEPAVVNDGAALYLEMLQYGALDEQPGVGLVASWYKRNFEICARIAQVATPGDRILVVYGSGHAALLRHCLGGMPAYRIHEANDYLPD